MIAKSLAEKIELSRAACFRDKKERRGRGYRRGVAGAGSKIA
jgi:hypothetical protein